MSDPSDLKTNLQDEADFPGFPETPDLTDPDVLRVLNQFANLTDDDIDHQAHYEAEHFLEEHGAEMEMDYWKTQHWKKYEERRNELTANREKARELIDWQEPERREEEIPVDEEIQTEEHKDEGLRLGYKVKK